MRCWRSWQEQFRSLTIVEINSDRRGLPFYSAQSVVAKVLTGTGSFGKSPDEQVLKNRLREML
jgi:hypothetical protein